MGMIPFCSSLVTVFLSSTPKLLDSDTCISGLSV
jgi:hypothetical protein